MSNLIVAVDIGTSKIFALAAHYNEDQELEVLAAARQPCLGLKKGVVVNIEKTITSVDQIINELEQACQQKISSFFLTVGGGNVEGVNSSGVVAVSGKDNEIQIGDIERVLEAARAIKIPLDREMLHVLPQEYRVDQVSNIKNPLNMIGVRLEANVHIITGNTTTTRNLLSAVNRAGFEVEGLGFSALAASCAAISSEEKNMGVLHLDLGAGTTNVLVFSGGANYYTNVIPIGGERLTLDIAQVWKITEEEAEVVKKESGHTYLSTLVDPQGEILIRGVGTRSTEGKTEQELCKILESRLRELFDLVINDLSKKGLLERVYAGLVLTGGGAALSGIVDLCEEVFKLPVRLGYPSRVLGLKEEFLFCQYTGGVGLLLYSEQEGFLEANKSKKIKQKKSHKASVNGWFSWLKKWV